MITLNDTPTIDSDVKWVVKILGDNNTYYMTDSDNGLVLTNTYVGDALRRTSDFETLSQITDGMSDMSMGGGLGQVSSFAFEIIRWSTDPKLDGFMNEFYPATGGQYLIGREVNVGVIWNGTTDSNITWFKRFYIEDYSYEPNKIKIYCVEKTELDWMQLPYYAIQKDYNNGISYFPNAPSENFGKSIPIVYGSFWNGLSYTPTYYYSLAPGLVIDGSILTSIYSSHQCYDDSYDQEYTAEYTCYIFISSADTYLRIYKTQTSGQNSVNGYQITMQYIVGNLYGEITLQLTEKAEANTGGSIINIIDKDFTTYESLGGVSGSNVIALRLSNSLSFNDVGVIDNSTLLRSNYWIQSTGGARTFDMQIKNNNLETPAVDTATSETLTGTEGTQTYKFHNFNNSTSLRSSGGRSVSSGNWDVADVLKIDHLFTNTSGGGNNIKIYSACLSLKGLRLTALTMPMMNNIRNTFDRGIR